MIDQGKLMLRKIYLVLLGFALIGFAIYLLEFDTVESLNRFYDGKGFVRRILMILYSTIGQIGTIVLLIALAFYAILSQFGVFDKKKKNL